MYNYNHDLTPEHFPPSKHSPAPIPQPLVITELSLYGFAYFGHFTVIKSYNVSSLSLAPPLRMSSGLSLLRQVTTSFLSAAAQWAPHCSQTVSPIRWGQRCCRCLPAIMVNTVKIPVRGFLALVFSSLGCIPRTDLLGHLLTPSNSRFTFSVLISLSPCPCLFFNIAVLVY